MINGINDSKIKISVIIPIYNSESSLERCLDSVLAQNLTEWECICVDDGSTDGSRIILDKYKTNDSRFKVIEQKNSGPSVARNNALDNSNGDYVVFLDSDDYIFSDYLQTLYDKIIGDNSDMCCCGYCSKDGENVIKQHDYLLDDQSKEYYLQCLFSGTGGTVCSKIYSLELIRNKNLQFNTAFSLCEDQLFALEAICNAKKISSVDYYGYYYDRCNDQSITSKIDSSLWITQLELLDYMNLYMTNHKINCELKNDLLEIKFKNVLYGVFSSMNPITREKWKNIVSNNTIKNYLRQIHIQNKYDFAYVFPVKIRNYVLVKMIYSCRQRLKHGKS